MANLGRKGKIFLVRFRYDGKEYKKSLKVRDLQEAEAARSLVEVSIHRLHTGQIQIPDGVNAGDFIVSGGTARKPKSIRIQAKRIDEVISEYLEAQRTYLAVSTHSLFTIHLNHWRRHLGGTSGKSITLFTHSDLEEYLRKRAAGSFRTDRSPFLVNEPSRSPWISRAALRGIDFCRKRQCNPNGGSSCASRGVIFSALRFHLPPQSTHLAIPNHRISPIFLEGRHDRVIQKREC